jgi:hypothetical protein
MRVRKHSLYDSGNYLVDKDTIAETLCLIRTTLMVVPKNLGKTRNILLNISQYAENYSRVSKLQRILVNKLHKQFVSGRCTV